MTVEHVTFASDGIELAGDLHLPHDAGPVPGVVLTGPLSGVKEQVTGVYAQRLAQQGVAALAFDHRNFGASAGTPRQHEDSAGKLADLRDALSELAVHPRVDEGRLAVVGICLGGGYALQLAATDPRAQACVTVAGCFNDPTAFQASMGPDVYRRTLHELAAVATAERRSGRIDYMPAVAQDGPAVMPGDEPYAYYGTQRGAARGWSNQLTRRSIHSLLTLDTASWAPRLAPTPLLVIHPRGDDYCAPTAAERIAYAAGGEIAWINTSTHIDLYDVDEHVSQAVDEAVAFLERSWR